MKNLYISLIALLLSFSAGAQCPTSISYTDIYHHDTTYRVYMADTTSFSELALYTWTLGDGSVMYGYTITVPYTADSTAYGTASSFGVTVAVLDTACTDTVSITAPYPPVFNCSYLSAAYVYYVMENSAYDPTSVSVILGNGGVPLPWDYHLTFFWGTPAGDSVVVNSSTPLLQSALFGGAGLSLGGPLTVGYASVSIAEGGSDTTMVPVTPPYHYTGVYNMSTSVIYTCPGDGYSCPVFNSGIMPVQIHGQDVPPIIIGDTVLCAGVSLHLIARDTTFFHNLAHMSDTTGYYLVPGVSGVFSLPVGAAYPNSYIITARQDMGPYAYNVDEYTWYNGDESIIVNDTALTIASVPVADSGYYYFNINDPFFDDPTGLANDTVHITVNPIAGPVIGTTHMCAGDTVMLSDSVAGGTWSVFNTAIASVNPYGIVTGIVAAGTGIDTAYYTVPGGCPGAVAGLAITVDSAATIYSSVPHGCIGSSYLFAASPSTGGSGTWSSSNDAAASVNAAGDVVPVGPGTAVITYTSGAGCSTTKVFTAYTTPTVTASVLHPVLCPGIPDTLLGSGATTYDWSPSAGILCTSCGSTFFLIAGTYTLTGTDTHGCISTATTAVIAGAIPTATASNDGPLCAGSTLGLTGTPSAASSYYWTGPGGYNSAAADPLIAVVPVSAAGVYTFFVTNSCGTASGTTTVVINALPVVTATYSYPALCSGTIDSLFGSGAATYSWSPSSGLTCALCNNTQVTAAGTYTLTGMDLLGCTGTAVVSVGGAAVPTVTANNNGPLCPGQILDLTSIVSGGLSTATWAGPDGFTSTAADTAIVGITSGAAGVYTLTVTNDCGTTTTTTTLSITTPVITATATPPTCGDVYVLAASGADTYSWLPATGLSCASCPDPATADAGTYTVTGTTVGGCSGSATVTISGNHISGFISFTGTAPDTLDTKVWLIQFNPTDSSLIALDSTVTCLSAGTPYYEFDGEAAGSYMVKAALIYGNTPGSSGYIPTYGLSTPYWNSAAAIAHTSGFDNQNINMIYGTVPAGPGFIGGLVTAGADKGTSVGVPVPDMMIYLINSTTGKVITYTTTDATGAYSFTGLAAGTYRIYPEDYQYFTTPSANLVLTAAADSMAGVNFKQHTLSKTITPYSNLAVNTIQATGNMSVYPNPTSGMLNIQWQRQLTGNADVMITDVTGREVYKATVNISTTSGASQADVSALKDGIYLLNITSANISYTDKLTIQH